MSLVFENFFTAALQLKLPELFPRPFPPLLFPAVGSLFVGGFWRLYTYPDLPCSLWKWLDLNNVLWKMESR